jgi:hypothetical protein
MRPDLNVTPALPGGPDVCAEWDNGGLPTWLNDISGMTLRADNTPWKTEMEKWFRTVVGVVSAANMFASQGGPVVLVQVENELWQGGPYVDWCGTMAENALKATPVPLIMCNGESAKNTIVTSNDADATSWLEKHGQSGKILVSQPAIWTEMEGGFQTWGGSAQKPGTYYMWGRYGSTAPPPRPSPAADLTEADAKVLAGDVLCRPEVLRPRRQRPQLLHVLRRQQLRQVLGRRRHEHGSGLSLLLSSLTGDPLSTPAIVMCARTLCRTSPSTRT